ncbi:MAG TPA: AMP-binding protein [Bryobacteraceae bacterium]
MANVVRRETLLDFFEDLAVLKGEFLLYDDGYRSISRSYREVARAARAFALKLRAHRIAKGHKIVLCSENRPEWVAALWGCLLEGVIAVPVDYHSSAEFAGRIAGIVDARAILTGDSVRSGELSTNAPKWPFEDFSWPELDPEFNRVADVRGDDIAQIVFTSGATAEPKGVIITHRNLLANIVPVENEILKYRKYGRPFYPLRFLNLLPLSHLFGQTLATFIPPMLTGTVVFQRSYHPAEIVEQIHSRRISVLVAVPKILEVLRDHILREFPESAQEPAAGAHWLARWWRFRRVHRAFGWKFWALITGAAPLDASTEEFWGRLGFLVIQGYGLTETAPIVTLNHPFHTRRGSVGKPVGGVEVRLADDGEVLVRGGNVSQGYFGQEPREVAAEEWLHTGDIGEMDAEGRLTIRGRKKDMIVLVDGRKVFPEDVEATLRLIPGVRDCAVIGPDRVHAVLITEPGADAEEIVRLANNRLEEQQKIRAISLWPGDELPRTAGTGKLKRAEIRQQLTDGVRATESSTAGLLGILRRYAPDRTITPETTLDQLGLSSLDRVQLLMELEQHLDTTIDEGAFTAARKVSELTQARAPETPFEFPSWNRGWLARTVRGVIQAMLLRPLTRYYAHTRVAGLENLKDLKAPVIFASNHQSFMDVPAILCALPSHWRNRIAPAMAKEFFDAHFHSERFPWTKRFTNTLQYLIATLFFNAFPLPQREMGAKRTLRYMGSLTDQGWCVLIFPEGDRTRTGEIHPFRSGVAMLASHARVPVVPVRIEGLERVLHRDARWPTRGGVTVTFGVPLTMKGSDYAAEAARLEAAVRNLY